MDELKKRIGELENRMIKIEEILLKDSSNVNVVVSSITKTNYKGLAGGIRLLISNNFFNELRSLKIIINELKREGYYATDSGVASTLFTTFVKNKKILNRIKENKEWSYVIRK